LNAPASRTQQYLTFVVAGDEYAVDLLDVTEIVQCSQITRVPSMPTSIRGVTNLRGTVVPVIDLAVRFGRAESQLSKWSCIVMVEATVDGERGIAGLLVDAVSQVHELSAEAIAPPPSFGTKIRAELVRGMAIVGERFLPVLDLEPLLAVSELMVGSLLPALSEATAADGRPLEPRPNPAAESCVEGL